MAATYDKALKRKDYSGVIDKDKVKEAADKIRVVSGDKTNEHDRQSESWCGCGQVC